MGRPEFFGAKGFIEAAQDFLALCGKRGVLAGRKLYLVMRKPQISGIGVRDVFQIFESIDRQIPSADLFGPMLKRFIIINSNELAALVMKQIMA